MPLPNPTATRPTPTPAVLVRVGMVVLGTAGLVALAAASAMPASVAWGGAAAGPLLAGALALAFLLALGEALARTLTRAHQRLEQQASEMRRLALVAQHTSNGVCISDHDRCIVWVNEAFTRLWGYGPDEAHGHRLGDLLASDCTDPTTMQRLAEAQAQGRGVQADVLLRAKDGVDRWVGLDVQPIHGPRGTLVGFISVATDVSALVAARQRTAAMLSVLPAGVVVQDASGTIVDTNPAASEVLGLKRDQLVGSTAVEPDWQVLRDDLRPYPKAERPPMRTLRDGHGLRGETIVVVTPDGVPRWLTVNTEPLRNTRGEVDGVVSCFVDVTDQRREQRMLAMTLECAGLGLWEWDLVAGRVQCNDRFTGMLGYRPGELPLDARSWIETVHPEDRDRWRSALQVHLDDPTVPYRQELRLRRADGGWSQVTSTGAVVERSPGGRPTRMAGIHIDMTDHMQMQAMLVYASNTDGLTQLANRASLLRRVQAAIDRHHAEPGWHFAVLYMDFDRFKQVNDTFGHAAGDELLRQIAQRLTSALRPGDAVGQLGPGEATLSAARIGGDEFVVLLEDVGGLAGAEAVARRLLKLLSEPYTLLECQRVHSTASIGIVTSELGVKDADTVMRDADTAMYEAKRAGRGRHVVFHPSMHEKVARSASLEQDLRAGLPAGQLFPVYQPIVNLHDGEVVAVEALARWQHPVRGSVPPVEFIPVAEETGLIAAVGQQILERACTDFMRWRNTLGDRAPTMIAVNLSRAQLLDDTLIDDVRAAIGRSGIDPACLQLEITESLAAQDAGIQAALHRLKALGVTLALDDFGTGYSSLACLHQLPIDTVKIDRSFVRDAQQSDYHRVLIEATVQVARSLGLGTVAEGVETEGQMALMRSLRCGKAQGFLFSRPLGVADLERWVAERQGDLQPVA